MTRDQVRVFLLAVATLAGVAWPIVSTASPEPRSRLEILGLAPTGAALAGAISAQQHLLVDLLLAARADVNGTDAEGRTPLFAAAFFGDWELVPKLLAAGADANRTGPHRVTPLMLAAAGHQAALRALLDHGAALDAADEFGHTALHYAIAANRRTIALYLLSLNPKPAPPCTDGRDLLALATETQDWSLIGPILERLPAGGGWNVSARSALAYAVAAKDVEKTRLVLSKFSGPPVPDGHRQPLLAYAAAVNELALGRLLLDAGADPNTPVSGPLDPDFIEDVKPNFLRNYLNEEPGMTTLMVAAGLGHTEFVKLLLEKGASRSQATRSKYKLVPLYFAAWGEHAETLQVLIGNAPSPNEMRIEISLASQRATLFRDGVSSFNTGISTGRKGFPTPTGQFVITDKKIDHVSTIYKVKMPYFMRLNCRDFGMHEGDVPDYPASHGCIRLPAEAARKFFKEVPIGTLVTITN
jgi:ankyrin repeat protein